MSEHRINGKQKIAIVGHGFVGKAIEYGFNTNGVELLIIETTSLVDFLISRGW